MKNAKSDRSAKIEPKYSMNIYKTDRGYTAEFLVDGKVVHEIAEPNSYQLIFARMEPGFRLAPFEHP